MGGPAPVSPNVIVVRYLGSSNHEIAYRDTVLLLNAHYARVAPARPLGFTRDEVKKADAILVGHGHGDHMSDAPYVAGTTGARLVGAPITAEQAQKMGLDRKGIDNVTGRDGEVLKFGTITVEPVLGRHGAGGDAADEAASAAFRPSSRTPWQSRRRSRRLCPVRLDNPRFYMPTHHDEVGAGRLDTPMEPLLLRLRDELDVRGISPLYRQPVCFDTSTKQIFVGW